MKSMTLIGGFVLMLMATTRATAAEEPMQSHQSIREAAEAFMARQVQLSHGMAPEASAGRLDSRLRLSACEEPLETFLPAGGRTLGNTIAGVRCPGTKPWSIYVPVQVSLYANVVVAAQPLPKGGILRAQDLKLVEKDLARLHSGYYMAISQVVGKQVKRAVNIGAPLTTAMLDNPLQIKRGQRVSLVASAAGLEVQMTGEALDNGAAGDRIQARNLSTNRVVEGVVLSATTIQVDR